MIPRIKQDLGEAEIVDIPTMRGLSDEDYRHLIDHMGVVLFDHHEVLRCAVCTCPLATTREQMDVLIAELQRLRELMAPSRPDALVSVDDTDKPAA